MGNKITFNKIQKNREKVEKKESIKRFKEDFGELTYDEAAILERAKANMRKFLGKEMTFGDARYILRNYRNDKATAEKEGVDIEAYYARQKAIEEHKIKKQAKREGVDPEIIPARMQAARMYFAQKQREKAKL